jgi:hypothetical protein
VVPATLKKHSGPSQRWAKGKGPDMKRGVEEKPRRKGLYQVMVEKELEEEKKQVLRAIIILGENGLLDEARYANSP